MLGPLGEYSCVSGSGIHIPFWQYGHFRVSPARSSETLSDFWQCGQGNLKYVVIKRSSHREKIRIRGKSSDMTLLNRDASSYSKALQHRKNRALYRKECRWSQFTIDFLGIYADD